jgi:hypothetical protein
MQNQSLFICTTCLYPTSLGQGMQRCHCEEYKAYPGVDCPSGYHLCYVCAAVVVGGDSRWSWEACESCLRFTRSLKSKYGVSLSLGRHSIMNSIGVPINASPEEQEGAIDQMMKFINQSQSLEDWALLQARILFESVPSWQKMHYIPRAQWEAKFHLSKVKATSRSVQCIKDYLRIAEFDELL